MITVALAGGMGACSKKGDDSSSSTTAPATTEASTTTAKATTSEADGSSTTEPATDDASVDPWTADAIAHRDAIGKTFDYACPAGGNADSIWGVETYTDDSSVCTAAVHVGLITVEKGGDVTIKIAAGKDAYDAGTANGITSSEYAAWPGSFIFPKAPPGSGKFDASPATWSITAESLSLKVGQTAVVTCSAGGQIGTIYGTGVYTADSYVCSAAVHVGLITQKKGGPVKVELVKGASTYTSTTAHGITSVAYGAFDPAFTFPDDQPGQG